MNSAPLHSMRIRDLRLEAHLGCTAKERSVPQEIRVNAELRFFEAPPGSVSDSLEETICYAGISEAFRRHLKDREFSLVEKMAADFHDILKNVVQDRAAISLSVHKVRPPVEGLLGGVEYRIGDFA